MSLCDLRIIAFRLNAAHRLVHVLDHLYYMFNEDVNAFNWTFLFFQNMKIFLIDVNETNMGDAGV